MTPRILFCLSFALLVVPVYAQNSKPQTEDDYYPIATIPLLEGQVLEVGGLEWLDDVRQTLAVCTRRGEVWSLKNPYAPEPTLAPKSGGEENEGDVPQPSAKNVVTWNRMLFGLHEPLGLLRYKGALYSAQRGELSKLDDADKDGRIDSVTTVCDDWEISGSYHEYAFGPELDKEGYMWVTLNRAFGGEPEGKAYWRGWAMRINPETGEMQPYCFGLRSPAGIGMNAEGDFFYTDNQGDWVASCKLSHMSYGSYQGNPLAFHTLDHPDSPFKDYPTDKHVSGLKLADARDAIPGLVLPAIWFPYPRLGKSSSDILLDDTNGKFGPFSGQLFVGDQSTSIISRVYLEKVNGEYQGAAFPFREGFQCGVLRMCWGNDGTMFVGQTNRGWGSSGGRPYGLQRLTWSGETPLEVHEMHAKPDGFELTFTLQVTKESLESLDSYKVKAWTYYHHSGYGCSPVDTHDVNVSKAVAGADGKSVRLTFDGLKEGYVYEVKLPGVRDSGGAAVLHPEAYYTLNDIPEK